MLQIFSQKINFLHQFLSKVCVHEKILIPHFVKVYSHIMKLSIREIFPRESFASLKVCLIQWMVMVTLSQYIHRIMYCLYTILVVRWLFLI